MIKILRFDRRILFSGGIWAWGSRWLVLTQGDAKEAASLSLHAGRGKPALQTIHVKALHYKPKERLNWLLRDSRLGQGH